MQRLEGRAASIRVGNRPDPAVLDAASNLVGLLDHMAAELEGEAIMAALQEVPVGHF